MVEYVKAWSVCRLRNGKHELMASYRDEQEARWQADRLTKHGDGDIYIKETVLPGTVANDP